MADSKYPLNQILYGPPGTGKTYQTINRALEILGCKDDRAIQDELTKLRNEQKIVKQIPKGDEEEDKRIRAKVLFDYYREQGRIEFVTFHQSYSYEEFVEGIRPEPKGNQVDYPVKDGVFKKICERAKKYLSIQSQQVSNEKSNNTGSSTEGRADAHHENIENINRTDKTDLKSYVDNLFNRFVKALEERYKEKKIMELPKFKAAQYTTLEK